MNTPLSNTAFFAWTAIALILAADMLLLGFALGLSYGCSL